MHKALRFTFAVLALSVLALAAVQSVSAYHYYDDSSSDYYYRESSDWNGRTVVEKSTVSDRGYEKTTYTKIKDSYDYHPYRNSYSNVVSDYWRYGPQAAPRHGWYHRGYAYDDTRNPTYYDYHYNPAEFYNGDYWDWSYHPSKHCTSRYCR